MTDLNNFTYKIIDLKTRQQIGTNYKGSQRRKARNRAEKLNLEYGAHRYIAVPIYV